MTGFREIDAPRRETPHLPIARDGRRFEETRTARPSCSSRLGPAVARRLHHPKSRAPLERSIAIAGRVAASRSRTVDQAPHAQPSGERSVQLRASPAEGVNRFEPFRGSPAPTASSNRARRIGRVDAGAHARTTSVSPRSMEKHHGCTGRIAVFQIWQLEAVGHDQHHAPDRMGAVERPPRAPVSGRGRRLCRATASRRGRPRTGLRRALPDPGRRPS